ncbi:Aspartate carbamoyltransferase regulatory chain [Candidatus Gugararchaeum adminiculabundum]|nr:Aspartate carbamoyltransferase regulatory chain [Candidatus Gugararchaeum adminiculabundum]
MSINVEPIESGSVIDHIKAGRGLKVLRILGISEEFTGRVALVMNVTSKAMGKKDIVKIEGIHIDEKTADKISLIAPNASLNIVKNSKVVEKRKVVMPEVLIGVAKCPNPKCISSFESSETRFKVEKMGLRCAFCERVFQPEELLS